MSWVKSYCRSGCPAREQLDDHVLPYWSVKDSLTLARNLLLCNCCIVIPPVLRRSILEKIHGPHQGLQKSHLYGKCSVWWQQLDNFIKSCFKCAEYSMPARDPMLPTPLPSHPWERVRSDLFELQGKHFLLLVDSFRDKLKFSNCKERHRLT